MGEGTAERTVDLAFRQSQTGGGVAVDDQVRLQSAGLQIGIDVRHFLHVLQRYAQLL